MALDRSKFKATQVATMQAADKEVNNALGRGNKERADVLEIEDGRNKFRLYPPHPAEDGGGDVFAEPVVRVFLPAYVDEMKDGKPVMEGGKPKKKRINKPVFNSRIHGDTEKDLVEEYRKLAERNAKEKYDQDTEAIKEYLVPIYGRFSKNPGERVTGIMDKQSWVSYADKITENKQGVEQFKFGRIEFNKVVKERLNKIAAVESASEPMGTDPFTPIEEGRAVIVDYNSGASKPQDYYTTEIDGSTTTVEAEVSGKKTQLKVQKTYPLTDDQLENFGKFPTLKSLFRGAFKRKDFELQLEGLRIFDEENNMGIFDTDEFEAIVAEIGTNYPEETTAAENTTLTASKANSTDDEEDDEQTGDSFSLMSRAELKEYITIHKLGIVSKKSMSDDDIRNLIREAELAAQDPDNQTDDDEEDDITTPVKEEVKSEATDKKQTAAEKVAAMKAKMGKK